MGPTFTQAYDNGIKPCWISRSSFPGVRRGVGAGQGLHAQAGRQGDLALFVRLSKIQKPAKVIDLPLRVVTPRS